MGTGKADLSSLRIDGLQRDRPSDSASKRRRFFRIVIPLVLIVAGAASASVAASDPAIKVKTAVASFQSPAESQALLTASGYVVAERKATDS